MDLRNIAIIAHVDHGKTTLVDAMLKQTHTFRDNEAEMGETTILDSNDLEREKGITILAKTTSVMYNGTKINIIDTPGHADFGGEVERVINMADGALLIVDAAEGPLPQTQFVTTKALERNLPMIVLINKIDRQDARPETVLHDIEELFLRLATHDDHLGFTVMYGVGRAGKVWDHIPTDFNEPGSCAPLFETILKVVPPPSSDTAKPFKMLVSNLDFDDYKGAYAIGKVSQGTVKPGQPIVIMEEDKKIGTGRIEYVFTNRGLKRDPTDESAAGDIIAVTGLPDIGIGQTLTDPSDPTGFPKIAIQEPTLKIMISANTSPYAGREGKFVTARQIGTRLVREKKINLGLRIEENPGGSSFIVAGRGELHLAVLLETLRREGYELQVGKPEVIFKEIDGVTCEPYEELTVDIDQSFVGVITEEMGRRKAELIDTRTDERGVTRIVYKVSSRNLLGFRGDILTKTRGNGVFSTMTIGYFPMGNAVQKLRNGVLVSLETGPATAYALEPAQERGRTFVTPGTLVYEGMIVGLNSRLEDIEINVCRSKRLNNIHSANADIAVHLDAPMILTLEQCLDFIEDDELLEITPQTLRLRKKYLTKTARDRVARGLAPTV
jgi:GTP-binding protein